MNRWSLLGAGWTLAIALNWLGSTASAADDFKPLFDSEQVRIAAIAKAVKPSVGVFARGGNGGGSGVVITPDGFALTNFHVTKPCGSFMKCSMSDGRLYDAVIVGIDPVGDVALIKLIGRNDFPVAELADSDTVRVGDWCFAVGNPFLLATDFQPTVTWGLVSGTHRYQPPAGTLLEYTDCIQTDAAINPGNSGGPLFNAQGQLIGINGRGSFEKRGRVNVGVGYAISINQIKLFLGHLRSGRIVDHATLGASVSTNDEGNVIVSNILETSDAYRRGLRYGDQLLAFGGRNITTVNGFKNVLGIYPKGWRVPVSYFHEGKRRESHMRLSGVHAPSELIAKVQGEGKPREVPFPKPGQPEKPKPEGEKPDAPRPEAPKPEGPMPMPMPKPIPLRPMQPNEEPVAEELQKLYKAKSGYANYYFNEQNRDRVWNAFKSHGDYASLKGPWKFSGQFNDGAYDIVLGTKELVATMPTQISRVDLSKPVDEQLGPPGSGGLLTALHLWQRLMVEGPTQYGDVYYLGTEPLGVAERKGLYDVLVATRDAIECHFIFAPETGELAAMEMWGDPTGDPCEIYFSEYREVEGRRMPHRMIVLYGDDVFGVLQVEKWSLATQGE